MTRRQLLKSPQYWVTQYTIDIYKVTEEWHRRTGKEIKELAHKCKIHPVSLSGYRSGLRTPSIDTYVKILLVCGKVPKTTIENLKDQK